MAKQNENKLPKYLQLVDACMWMDIYGPNCSNVRLSRAATQFIGRGHFTDEEWSEYKNQGFIEPKDIPKDAFGNQSAQGGQYGFVEVEKDESFFCTDDIPEDKRGNIIKAYQMGNLVAYDPDKVQKEIQETKIKKNFGYNPDGDLVFTGTNKHMFDKLNNASHEDLIAFIKHSPMNARQNLLDLYDYELQGLNRVTRPRHTILEAIRARLNEFGPGMSGITVERNVKEK